MKINNNLNTGNIIPSKITVTKEKVNKPLDKVTIGQTSPDMSFLMDKDVKNMKSTRLSPKAFGRVMGGFAGISTGVIAGCTLLGALSPSGAVYAAAGVGLAMAVGAGVHYRG